MTGGDTKNGDRSSNEFLRRYEEIRNQLDAVDPDAAQADRDAIRDGIIGLFRDVEARIAELSELRDGIRPLVDRFRELFPAVPGRTSGQTASAEPVQGGDGGAPERSTRIDHLGSSTYLERGWNAIAGGDYERAVDELEKALALAPGHDRAEALLGWALMRLGQISDARAVLEPLVGRDPANHIARANLGYVEMREGRLDEAIEHLSAVARESTDRTASLYAQLYLGIVYAEREMYDDAEATLTRALEMGPNLIEAYWELGRVHYRAGDRDAAAEAWKRGAETNRFNPWGERCGEAADRIAAGEAISLG